MEVRIEKEKDDALWLYLEYKDDSQNCAWALLESELIPIRDGINEYLDKINDKVE